jgi:crotonobetainyl-CoA:carnitine CoA-transferase CaiB-like acyl-CoA transferase
MRPLEGIGVLTLAVNLPGPLAAARLHELGAAVTKVEPPGGDLLARAQAQWYEALHQGLTLLTIDLKSADGRKQLDDLLGKCDLLLTSTRPAALRRLGLDWPTIHDRYPRLCQVAIIGFPSPHQDVPGHDLTYQAQAGLLDPPRLPRSCLADLAGAQQAVAAALAVLLARERGQPAQYAEVSLAKTAEDLAATWRYGLTRPDGLLGGACPGYNLYRTRQGWIAVAALEAHFWDHLLRELDLTESECGRLSEVFQTRTAAEWETWAAERDLPLVRVREVAD